MLATLVIVFREVFEAGLIVGIVLAATEGVARRGAFIARGVAAGLAGATLLASFAGVLSGALEGMGQEVFTASILIVATLMLGWHQIWMAAHGREIAREMRGLGQAVAAGHRSLLAMAVVVAIAVLREGGEVVLFLYGVAASSGEGAASMVAGGIVGIALGAATSYALYRGLVAIPVHRLFTVTGWLIALLAAGMAGQAAAVLAGADLIPSWGYQLWDTSWLLPQASLPGRALHALVGYSDRPMGVQLAAYVLVLGGLLVGARLAAGTRTGGHGRKGATHARPLALGLVLLLSLGRPASAREYYIGGPVHEHDLEIVANYLVGVEMDHSGMATGPDVIHLEADVHATADNVHGFPDGAWVPYLTVHYRLEKQGTPWQTEGTLRPMQAKDGPHYADNVRMDGPGTYTLTYRFSPPDANGYMRHVDKETGIPEWWKPFTTSFKFEYPQR